MSLIYCQHRDNSLSPLVYRSRLERHAEANDWPSTTRFCALRRSWEPMQSTPVKTSAVRRRNDRQWWADNTTPAGRPSSDILSHPSTHSLLTVFINLYRCNSRSIRAVLWLFRFRCKCDDVAHVLLIYLNNFLFTGKLVCFFIWFLISLIVCSTHQ